MSNRLVQTLLVLSAMALFEVALPCESYSAEDSRAPLPTAREDLPFMARALSAARLSYISGLQVVETLIIGDVESVVAGKIPVASTIPTTIGIVTPPDSLPSVLPTPRRKSDALEFDRPIYAARQNSKFTGEEIYASLFKPLYENKPYAISTLIKPVINAQAVNTEDARKIKTKRAVKAKPTKKQKAEKKSKTPSRSKKSKFY